MGSPVRPRREATDEHAAFTRADAEAGVPDGAHEEDGGA